MIIPYFINATIKWDGSSVSSMVLKTIYTALLHLKMTLHECSLIDNARSNYPEQPCYKIIALLKSFLIPTETCIWNSLGYKAKCGWKRLAKGRKTLAKLVYS